MIQVDLYAYAVETCFLNAFSADKKKVSSSQVTSGLYKSVQPRFMTTHQYSYPFISDNRPHVPDVCLSKHVRVENEDPEHID
ncbi:9076_t:CDS:2 [Gigaspora margarita]|uniref:9076_t:CDS:1 n=1 Tax=Gigaspora margarita TaxID=4874 RepID=A0ABN7UKH8_GIGMA|nr:9076_t:CDS:2 [Gigaspora margarita]